MDESWCYEICVQGYLGAQWSDWFEGMAIRQEHGDTILTGPLNDQAALYGVLGRIRDLNLILVSLSRLPARAGPEE